jgi:serine/threonine protein kinase
VALSPEEFGPYIVHEQLGLGGMATVHRAETKGIAGFSKQVALKRMLPNVAADANLVKSFIHEARLASNLRHANVAQTYDLGKVGETYFIAMELVPGRTLSQIVKLCLARATPVPVPIAINIITQICDALDYAHNLCDESGTPLGIIHRDVSPSNIIIGEGGIAKLIDFGIAKAAASHHTLAGTIKGKFSYMAPEYIDGFLDARADLFALGVIAHELFANKPLFQGRDDMDTLFRIKEMPVMEPSRFNPAVPPEIDSIVMTALARDPDKRWQNAAALRSILASEAQRLGLVAHNADVVAWIENAFDRANTESPDISISEGTAVLSGETPAPSWGRMSTNTTVDDDKPAHEPETKEIRPAEMRKKSPSRRENVFDTPTVVATVKAADIAKAQQSDDDDQIQEDLPTMATPSHRPTPPPRPTPKPPVLARAMPLPDDDDDNVSTIEQPVETIERPIPSDAPIAPPIIPIAPEGWTNRYLLLVLVLIAAGGAAAVVYFALP